MDITEISRRLSERAETVAMLLLPGGKVEGHEWVTGNVNGDSGKSCKVRISGAKAGVWKDFAGGQGGDLIDLWRETKRLSVRDTLQEVKTYLGIQDDQRPAKRYQRPEVPDVKPPEKILPYLQGRGITEDAISAYRVMENRGHIFFPSYRNEKVIFYKHLAVARDSKGKKKTWVSKDSEPCLFGWQAISPELQEITICEGEIDALTLHQYGIPALSVPFGAGVGGKHDWIENEWPYLEQYRTIYLCMDMDEEGRKAAKEIANRLGIHRCKIVDLPHKDPNECLQKNISVDVICDCFSKSHTIDPDELKRAGVFTESVLERFYPASQKQPGFSLPWEKTHGKIRIVPGEVSVWSGYNGSGKSLFLGQVVAHALDKGFGSCIASFEMAAERTLHRMVVQALGVEPFKENVKEQMAWFNEGIWIFDLIGTGKSDRMMDVFRYAYQRYGITQFVVDSLAKLGMAEDDYAGQKAIVERFGDFVRITNTHIHLVAHARKGKDEFSPPRKMDIKGTGAITDMVDNVYIIHRNKAKYRDIGKAKAEGKDTTELQKKPDALLICDKSRENGADAEGTYGLYFSRKFQKFTEEMEQ